MLNKGHVIGRNMTKIHRLELKYLKNTFKEIELSPSCFSFLMVIFHHPGISQKQLCEMTQMDEAIATRLVKDMVKKEYLIKEVNPKDHRAFQLTLTSKGKKIQPKIEKALKLWWDTLLEGLPVELLENSLIQLTQKANQIIEIKEKNI